VVAAVDPDLRAGVVSCAHGFGALPGEPADPRTHGASTNRLISSTRDRETINAMPRMSGFPVRVDRFPGAFELRYSPPHEQRARATRAPP